MVEKFENAITTGLFRFCQRKSLGENGNSYRDASVSEKLLKYLLSTMHAKPGSSNSFGLRSDFQKLRFLDGLLWMADLTVEIKLCF